jgi:hypothetical protein
VAKEIEVPAGAPNSPWGWRRSGIDRIIRVHVAAAIWIDCLPVLAGGMFDAGDYKRAVRLFRQLANVAPNADKRAAALIGRVGKLARDLKSENRLESAV